MSLDDRRSRELKERAQGIQAQLSEEERRAIDTALENYHANRDLLLEVLLKQIGDEGQDEHKLVYQGQLAAARDKITNILDGMLSGVTQKSDAALQLRERALVEEDGFFNALAMADAGGMRDEMIVRARVIREKIDALNKKWAAMTDEDRYIEERERQASQRMRALISAACEGQPGMALQISNRLGAVLEEIAKLPDAINDALVEQLKNLGFSAEYAKLLPRLSELGRDPIDAAKQLGIPAGDVVKILAFLTRDPGMWAGDQFKELLGAGMSDLSKILTSDARKILVAFAQGEYAAQVAMYKGLLPNQGSILVTLTAARRDVDQFIRDNGMDAARAHSDRCQAALARFRSDSPAGALQGDAAVMAESFGAALKARFDDVAEAFEGFVAQNSGRFFGSVSSETEMALLNSGSWQEEKAGMKGLALDEKVRLWREGTLAIEPKLTGAWSQIQGRFAGLPVELQAKVRDAVEALFQQALGEVRTAARVLDGDFEATARLVEKDQIERDLDRSMLLAQLRA